MQMQIFLNELRLLERRFWIGKLSKHVQRIPSQRRASHFTDLMSNMGENGLKRKIYWSEKDWREMSIV